jgi:hypothetical protein
MRALRARLAGQVTTSRRERAAFTERISGERRTGEHGQSWQVLQQRIDVRQTTEADIYAGIDLTPEAQEVRALLKQNLIRTRVKVEMLRERDPEVSAATAREKTARDAMNARLRGAVETE